jgi:putative GTP pyrophosphokinase
VYELKDNVLKENFDTIFEENIQPYNELMAYYKCAMMEVETKFRVLNEEFSLKYDRNPISAIKTRLKTTKSIVEKLNRYNFPISPESVEENLNDVAGVRVVCSFEKDVYLLAEALLSQDDIELISKKDYIKNPKDNGYRSLHLIVAVPIYLVNEKRTMRVEIQLRTISMDSWATLEHQLRYKKSFEFSDEMAEELFTCSKLSQELDHKMDKLRKMLNV